MRLLHTSDWHLGRSLHGADLRAAQAAFLDSLVETVRAERIDAVLVAGDVFDRAVPPVDAVAMCEDVLVRLRDAGARVVAISGNHDSARRLGFNSALADAAGVHVRSRVSALATPVLLADDTGPVAVYAVPYLEPDAVRGELPADPSGVDDGPPRGHAGVLGRAAACIRADLAARGAPRSVVLAHAWVSGGATSASERDITVGGVGCVPPSTFDEFSYAALGHLHRPQTLAESVRYSGSPLPYSFTEAGQRKGSWLVELGSTGLTRVDFLPAPVHRRLSLLRGTLDDLLTDRRYHDRSSDYLAITLTDVARPDDAMTRLRGRFPHALVLTWEPTGGDIEGRSYGSRVRGRNDLDVACDFVAHVRRTPAGATERGLLARAFEASRVAEAAEAGPVEAGCAVESAEVA